MKHKLEFFPDGTPIDDWFYDTTAPELSSLGKPYLLTDYGILPDGQLHTKEMQSVINLAAKEGGGVLVVPAGIYHTGALHFKQGVNLYVAQGGTLMGSDNIADYDLCETRMEGQNCIYFSALINADGVDGFTISGPGTIDGNGMRSWRAFWLRRKWNPKCTNKDEQRPRLVFISNSKNVTFANITLQNSHFWTSHLYRCDHVKYLNCRIFSPARPVPAPSTDAIDIDVCTNVLVKNCYLEVNDDSVVLKGGKGPWADTAPENGTNERILVEDCHYGFCHGCLTCGSESMHDRNILIRRLKVDHACNLLWLKMRPDTPQHYEYITMQQVDAVVDSFVNINPWTQFYDLEDRKDIPLSYADHITVEDCRCDCREYFNVKPEPIQYRLSDFTFRDLKIRTAENSFDPAAVEGMICENCTISALDTAPDINYILPVSHTIEKAQ